MLKDIKLGFKLLKYGYKLKLNVIMLVFFAIFGIASENLNHRRCILYDEWYVHVSAYYVYGCI